MKRVFLKQNDGLKRMLCLLLLAAVAVGLLASCSATPQREEEAEEPSVAESSATAFPQYRTKTAVVSDGKESVKLQQTTETGLLAFINRMIRDDTPQELLEDPDFVNDGRYHVYESALFTVSESGKRNKIRRYRPMEAPDNPEARKEYFSESRPRAFRMLADGRIVSVESTFESWQEDGRVPRYQTRDRYFVRLLEANGTEISTYPIEVEENRYGLDCEHLVLLAGGQLAVPQGNVILIFDVEGKRQFTVETPFPVAELCAAGGQHLGVLLKQGENAWVSIIDADARTVTVPLEVPADAHAFCAGTEAGNLCFLRGSEIFAFHTETGETSKLVSLLSLGINPSELGAFSAGSNGKLTFLVNDWDRVEECVKTLVLTATPARGASAKTVLTLGFLGISDRLEELLIRFNSEQTEVRIEAVDYGNLSEDQLCADCPDIVVMDEALYQRLSGERKLADLSLLLNEDQEFGGGKLFSSVLKALAGEDGSLRRISGLFRIETMACDSDTVGGRAELSLNEHYEVLAQMPDGGSLYEPYYTSGRLLEALTAVNRRQLVAGGQHNADLYAKLQAFSALQPAHYDYNSYAADTSSMESRIYDNRLLMMQAHIGTLEELKWYDAFFPSEACFVGWPTEEGSSSILRFDEMLAIGQHCDPESREAAWRFVRLILGDDYSDEIYGFPLRVSTLERRISEDMSAKTYRVNDKGKFILDDEGERVEQARSAWYSPEWRRHYEYALTETQRDKLFQIIEHAA